MKHQNHNSKLGKIQKLFSILSLSLTLVTGQAGTVMAATSDSSTAYTTPTSNVLFRDLKQAANAVFGLFSDVGAISIPPKAPAVKTLTMPMTAYTSEVGQCDDSPFVTADGSQVSDGIVATNVLPFGTKIRIPEYFGDKIFVVHDRMNARYTNRMDIWMDDKQEAISWGMKRNVTVEVVEIGDNKTQWSTWTKKRLAEQSVS